jgi:uncharacterized membrane protein
MTTTGPANVTRDRERAYAPFDPRSAKGRLFAATLVGLATAFLVFRGYRWPVRVVAGWDAGATALVVFVWWAILAADPETTRCRAAAVDPGRTAVWVLVSMASSFSLFAGTVVMRRARLLEPEQTVLLVGLCIVAVVMAWVLTHTSYTLRYAHLYYRDDDEGEGGLTFPGDRPPSDIDFAYFAYTVGMCFQVSDVVVTSPQIRRAVLSHAILSFAYNTVILAFVLNLLFGFLA